MSDPDILLHKKNQIAFEEITRRHAHKYVTRDTKKKVLDKAKQYGVAVAAPNVIAGTLGFAAGGTDGALEAMNQVSTSVLPYALAIQGLNDYIQSKKPLDNINYVLEQTRLNLKKVLKLVEDRPAMVIGSGVQTALSAAAFYGVSLFTEKLTGIEFNQIQMALTGAGIGLFNSGVAMYEGDNWKKRIADYAENNVEDIQKKSGERLELDNLEGIVRGALRNPDKTNKIYIASSEKRFRDVTGAFALFGELDKFADKYRDPTRIKPNVTLDLKSEHGSYGQKSPKFTFEYQREQSKTDTILDVARLINISSKDVEIKIHSLFQDAPLEDLLSAPYEQITAAYINGKKEGEKYFEIKYGFNEDVDNIEVTINSRQHLSVVLDLFESLYKRPIEDVDFDQDLVGMSEKQTALTKKNSPLILGNLDEELAKLGVDSTQFGLQSDILDSLKPLKGHGAFKKEDVPEQLEQPLSDLSGLPKKVLDIYKVNKDKIQQGVGFPTLTIAFEGVVYSLSPMDYGERGKRARTALYVAGNPLRTVKSLVTDCEVLPSLREVEVLAQMTGITRENVYEVIGEVGNRVRGLEVNLNMPSLDYHIFKQIPNNPQLLAYKAYNVEVRDGKGTKIILDLGDVRRSYKSVRNENFLSGESLEAKAEEFRQAREAQDFSKLGMFGMFRKSRFERELEEPTYEVVAANGQVPNQVIIFNRDARQPFMDYKTVHISTKDKIFIDQPVHPKEGIQRVTDYLVAIRDSIQHVGSLSR